MAESKLRRKVRNIARQYPEARIFLLGCMPTRDAVSALGLPGVEAVFENYRKREILQAFSGGGHSCEQRWSPVSSGGHHSRAFIKIQDGCHNACSYCIVSKLRGKPESRPADAVVREISSLAASGVPEVVLTGVNLASWGRDIDDNFASLLVRISETKPEARIRVSSIELAELTDGVLDALAGGGCFCPHLHIPLQSGSDSVLSDMNRHYSSAEFAERIAKAKVILGDIGLSCDVIVGFPTETEEDHIRTLQLCEEAGFIRIHAFSYSPRAGTKAFALGDRVSGDIKRRRIRELTGIADGNLERFVAHLNGRELEVVFEGDSSFATGRCGYSGEYIRVCSGGVAVQGSTITKVENYSLAGNKVVMSNPSKESYS